MNVFAPRHSTHFVRTFVAWFVVVLLAGPAWALKSDHVEASWTADVEAIAPGEPFTLGLVLAHAPHWHTYWKNPGDSGLATTIQWDLPNGFRAGEWSWPIPRWLSMQGQVIFGYEGTVILPVTVTPPPDLAIGQPVRVGGRIDWLECADVCIPAGGDLFITLPVEKAARPAAPPVLERIAKARAAAPAPAGFAVGAERAGDGFRFTFDRAPVAGASHQFFPADEYLFDLSDGIPVTGDGDRLVATAAIQSWVEEIPETLSGLLVITKNGDREAFSFVVKPGAAPVATSSSPSLSLPAALFGALLGGMILNLMPCVFPVISLKILGFVSLAGSEPRKVWIHGLVFSAGVLVSFWVLGGVLLLVKASAPSVGWGFQLKEPGFVVAVCLLFLLLSLNLFGVFELGTFLTTFGASGGDREGMVGTFLSGVLATIVATPCTAPFMGAAIGLALAASAAVAMAVFTAVGVGMCLPYLVLSRFPRWLNALPKPGPWMDTFKQAMGFLLLAFALFLVWVFAGLRDVDGLARLLVGMLLCGLAAWVYGRWGTVARATRTRWMASVAAVVLVIGGGVYAAAPPPASPWVPYSAELVQRLEANGEPYFIDFTATWCVTCQANKRLALNTRSVQARFREKQVTLIKADWTKQEEPITSALAAFGRRGVPLYVLHAGGPDAEATILPEVLSPDLVMDALDAL